MNLWFTGGKDPELDHVEFVNSEGTSFVNSRGGHSSQARVSSRVTKTDKPSKPTGTFSFTAAIQSLAILLVRHAAAAETGETYCLEGHAPAPATSLDYALDKKETLWMGEMFGWSAEDPDKAFLTKLIRRENSGSKSPSRPVRLSIKSSLLQPSQVSVFVDHVPVQDAQSLIELSKGLHDKWAPTAKARKSPVREGTVGVFGVAVLRLDGERKVLFNVRTDQTQQRQNAQLQPNTGILIVDLPGGQWCEGDESEESALRREVREETGCEISILSGKLGPFKKLNPQTRRYDYAFVYEIEVHGEPETSNEASEHVWLSYEELARESTYRLPSTKGINGRMGDMIRAVLHGSEENKLNITGPDDSPEKQNMLSKDF